MSTLSEILSRNLGQRQTTTTGGDDLSSKSVQQSGVTSPLGRSLLGGANPDQAKMYGTGVQKKAALDQAQSQTLSTDQRTQQLRTQQTSQEAAKIQQAQQIDPLKRLSDAVAQAVTGALAPPQQAAPITTYDSTLPENIYNQLNPAQKQTWEQFIQDPNNPNKAMLAYDVLVDLGVQNPIPTQYVKTRAIDTAISEQVQDFSTFTVQQLEDAGQLQQSMGMGIEDLSFALNVPVEQLSSLSIPQLQQKIRETYEAEFSEVSRLRNISSDPNVAASQRQQARAILKEKGALGIITAEEQVRQIQDQITNAHQVQFGNETMSAEKLLSDENISRLIGEYVLADDTKKARFTELYGQNFVDFIEQNRTILEEAASELDQTQSNFMDVQEQNRQLADLPNGIRLDDTIMDVLVPGWDKLQPNVLDVPDILKSIKDPSLTDRQQIRALESMTGLSADHMNKMITLEDGSQKALKDLNLQELASIGFFGEKFESVKSKWIMEDKLAALDPNSPDYGSQVQNIVLGHVQDLDKFLAQLKVARLAGYDNEFLNAIDSNKDGIIDDPSQLASQVQEYMNKTGAGFNNNDHGDLLFANINDPNKRRIITNENIQKALEDGTIDTDEMFGILEGDDGTLLNAMLETGLMNGYLNGNHKDARTRASDILKRISESDDNLRNIPDILENGKTNYQHIEDNLAIIRPAYQKLNELHRKYPSMRLPIQSERVKIDAAVSKANKAKQAEFKSGLDDVLRDAGRLSWSVKSPASKETRARYTYVSNSLGTKREYHPRFHPLVDIMHEATYRIFGNSFPPSRPLDAFPRLAVHHVNNGIGYHIAPGLEFVFKWDGTISVSGKNAAAYNFNQGEVLSLNNYYGSKSKYAQQGSDLIKEAYATAYAQAHPGTSPQQQSDIRNNLLKSAQPIRL